MKKFIGKIVVALVKGLMRAFLGMFIGIVFVGLIIIVLVFFDVLVLEELQNKGVFSEFTRLLLIGGGIGAVVGFFDMIDFSSRPSLHSKNIKVEVGSNSWNNRNGRHNSNEKH